MPASLLERPAATAADKEAVWAELMAMYDDGSGYGGLSQEAHGLQTAFQAEQAGFDAATIAAGLLHDIGWKLARPAGEKKKFGDGGVEGSPESIAAQEGILAFCAVEEGASAEQQRAQHDVIGSTWLQMRGFKYKVAHLVEGHVLAKRYLTGTDEAYNNKLSSGSKRTLEFQGGPMTAEEVKIFEKDTLFDENVQMRRWDEGAKVEGLEVPGWEHFKPMIMESIAFKPCSATEFSKYGGLAYERNGNKILAPSAANLAQASL